MRDPRFAVGPSGAYELSEDAPIYLISVAAHLAGMHPQTLRQYDRLGLVRPGRTGGGGRRYSLRDVAMLREVQRLSHEEGVNLAGIKRIIELEHEVTFLRTHAARLEEQLDLLRAEILRRARATTGRPALPVPVEDHSLAVWRSSRE